MNQYSSDPAEAALAKEFSKYLVAVSREVVDPIESNVERHRQHVEQLIASVLKAQVGLEASLNQHERLVSTTAADVVDSLRDLLTEMKVTVESIAANHEYTRNRLLSLFAEMRETQAGNIERMFGSLRKECVALTERQVGVIAQILPPAVLPPISAQLRVIKDDVDSRLDRSAVEASGRIEALQSRVAGLQIQTRILLFLSVATVLLLLFGR